MRGDDAAGLLVADYLERGLRAHTDSRLSPQASSLQYFFRVFRGHTAPENCTGAIKQFAPTHLIIVDAANLNKKPGVIALLEADQIGGISFSTHQMPLRLLIDYLKISISFAALVIAIQPAHLDYDRPVTPAVRHAASHLASALGAAWTALLQ